MSGARGRPELSANAATLLVLMTIFALLVLGQAARARACGERMEASIIWNSMTS
jgi:hypothetical protein